MKLKKAKLKLIIKGFILNSYKVAYKARKVTSSKLLFSFLNNNNSLFSNNL